MKQKAKIIVEFPEEQLIKDYRSFLNFSNLSHKNINSKLAKMEANTAHIFEDKQYIKSCKEFIKLDLPNNNQDFDLELKIRRYPVEF